MLQFVAIHYNIYINMLLPAAVFLYLSRGVGVILKQNKNGHFRAEKLKKCSFSFISRLCCFDFGINRVSIEFYLHLTIFLYFYINLLTNTA